MLQALERLQHGRIFSAPFWRRCGRNLDKSLTPGKDADDWGVRPDRGLVLTLPDTELADLATSLRHAEIIQRKDRRGTEPRPRFKNRQLAVAIQHLRKQGRSPVKPTE